MSFTPKKDKMCDMTRPGNFLADQPIEELLFYTFARRLSELKIIQPASFLLRFSI